VLAVAVFLSSLSWLAILRREFVPKAPGWAWLCAVITLGVGTGLPVVLRPAKFYQIAILSGVAFEMAALLCLTLAICRRDAKRRWLALASLCVGLAAGSRPTLIPGGLVALLLVAVWLWRKDGETAGNRGQLGRLVLTALGPVGFCLAAIGWYNWMRYDSPFEFGLHYQL
jgi:hypothetical protein